MESSRVGCLRDLSDGEVIRLVGLADAVFRVDMGDEVFALCQVEFSLFTR